MPKLITMNLLKFIYINSKGRTKPKKVHCAYGGKMDETLFLKAMEEVKTLNIKL